MTFEEKIGAMTATARDATWDDACREYRTLKVEDLDTPDHDRGFYNVTVETEDRNSGYFADPANSRWKIEIEHSTYGLQAYSEARTVSGAKARAKAMLVELIPDWGEGARPDNALQRIINLDDLKIVVGVDVHAAEREYGVRHWIVRSTISNCFYNAYKSTLEIGPANSNGYSVDVLLAGQAHPELAADVRLVIDEQLRAAAKR
jgi:hypothetical protein